MSTSLLGSVTAHIRGCSQIISVAKGRAWKMLTLADKDGRWVGQILTLADKGGRGVRQILTLADKGGRGVHKGSP